MDDQGFIDRFDAGYVTRSEDGSLITQYSVMVHDTFDKSVSMTVDREPGWLRVSIHGRISVYRDGPESCIELDTVQALHVIRCLLNGAIKCEYKQGRDTSAMSAALALLEK